MIFDSQLEASKEAFRWVKESMEAGAEVLGLATGSSPETLYQLLRESDLDFRETVSINLDEYYGLAPDHPQSYHSYMEDQLFHAKPFKESYLPDGTQADAGQETARYDQILVDHPIDLQILGIGTNAHIGFNEPGAPFDGRTQRVDLAPATIQANQRFFGSLDEVPRQAYSMGIGSIMEAKEIILLAFGQAKAGAIQASIEGPVTEAVPASILQRHPHVLVLLDREAASDLSPETLSQVKQAQV